MHMSQFVADAEAIVTSGAIGYDQKVRRLAGLATSALPYPALSPACQEALDQGVFSAAVIINILARKRDPQPAAILSIPDALRLTHEPLADCARYDSLRRAS